MLEKEEMKVLMDAYEMSVLPRTKPLPEGYISDYDKSVRWNEEMVEKSKEKYSEESGRLRIAKEQAIQDAKDRYVYPYIRDNLDASYTEEGIHFLFSTAYSNGHSGGIYNILSELDQLIELLNDMERFKNEKKQK